jgi:hypothetical protein
VTVTVTMIMCDVSRIEFAEGSYGQDLNPAEDVGSGPPDLIVPVPNNP